MDLSGMSADREEYSRDRDSYMGQNGNRSESYLSAGSRGTVDHVLRPPVDLEGQDRHRARAFEDSAERSNSGAAPMASQDGMDASFLSNHAGNGPRISERRDEGQAQDQSGAGGNARAGSSSGKHSARGRSRKEDPNQESVSFHVNPDFGNEDVSDSDVLVNAHASHNAGAQHSYPHSGQPATVMEDDGMLSPTGRGPNSPGSSRYPLPEEVLSPGGASGYTDRTGQDHSRAYRSQRRLPPGHSMDMRADPYLTQQSPNASVAATAELSMLIERAKQLLATTDGRSGEMQRLLGGSYAGSYVGGPRSEIGAPTPLHPVREHDQMDEEELLQIRLEAKDDLKSAYAMLNERYSAPAEKAMSLDELSELDGSGGAAKKNSGSLKGSDAGSEYGPAHSTVRPAKLLTTSEYKEQREGERRAKKMVRIKLFPMLLYCFFILAGLFYAYVRIKYGMGGLVLGLKVYSYIVLVIELMGALNMIFYGCWLFAKPVNDDVFPRADASTGKEAPFRRQYIVRVLIPCYKESLAIIQRTVLAAKRADRPPGTRMVIYICDDGNDEKKLAWVQRIDDPEVVYVTGRDKSQKQLNGKSANLNFCLQKIYPDEQDPEAPNELKKIPVNELMCLFDADQTCSRGFFMTMLRYIDSGDDVGVALSPQLMYNVIPDCDVFNHQNVHFWEMMQPGMDALGFISLTGTNMILRSRALQQAGWFPMNSVTEDWALGMRFKKLGYRCRYVNQYLAIGEAPDVTQQAFQQRSRWSKGHFQVFWSRECPLFDGRLNLFYRLAYSSTCVSYLSTGLSVIVLNLVPVLTILFGWFPIALNFWTVVGITAYFGALNALSYYCLSWSHYKALWLANNSSVILFWPYLKASIFTPVKALMGKTMVFKTTLKGAAAHNASLKVLWPAMLIALINVVSLILGVVNFRASVNAAQGISLCWLVFNTIPHLNLLFYSAFGPGGFMVGWCRFGMFVTTATSALAIVLMWLLYPREVDFREPLVASIRFLQAERSGPLGQNYTIDWRGDSGMQYKIADVDGTEGVVSKYRKQYTLPPFNITRDLSGGFYEDGPYGPVKLTKTNAMSTALTAWAALDLPDPFMESEEDGSTLMDDVLEVVKHGLEYLLQCFIKDPTEYVNPQGDIYVYQVGNIQREAGRWFRPEDVKTKEQILYTGGIAAPIDLTGQMTAGIVSATMLLHQHGMLGNKAVKANLVIAERLYNVTMEIKGVLQHDRKLWHSDSFYDDRLWAASWMYRAAASQYLPLEKASVYYADMVESHTEARIEEDTFVVDADYVLNMGVVHAAVNTFNWDFHAPAQSFLWDWICSGKVEYSTFGRAWAFDSPYLGDTALAAALAQIYSIRMKGWNLFPKKFERGFQCFAQQQARYMVGTGWQRKSFIVGVAPDRGYNRIMHHGASCPPWPQKCPQNMAASDQPDANVIRGGLLWAPEFDDAPKNTRGGNATAVSLGNNVAVPALFAGLLGKTNSWLECLQSNGALLEHPVCSRGRPSPLENNGELTRSAFWGRVFDVRSDEDDLSDSLTDAFPLTRNLGPAPKFKLNAQYFENDMVSLAGNAWLFYEAQRSGALPADNRVAWRGDSSVFDGDQHLPSLDLTGGWHAAGGSIKATMPFCASVWRLAWNLLSYGETYRGIQFRRNTLLADGKRQLLWAAEYLQRIHYNETNLIAMVGDPNADQNVVATEALMPEQYVSSKNFARPVIEINATSGGSDLLGEAVSAFASIALLFREVPGSEEFSNEMTKHARQLYDWMKDTPGTMYSEVHPWLRRTYPSDVPHAHMMLAAAWMFKLTNELKFETDASSFHSRAREQAINPVIGWRNPLQEAKILLLEANPNSEGTWLPGLMEWIDAQMFGDDVQYSQKGLWQTPRQDTAAVGGALANAANVANVALRAGALVDTLATTEDDAWMVVWAFHSRCLARQQMNYIMGSSGRSFVTGWGTKPPQRPHHRGASCAFVTNGTQCTGQKWANPKLKFANTLPGGLVGGPNLYDEFNDNHLEEVQSRVSIEANAALLGSVSSMMELPAHFWLNKNFCPAFPINKVKWTTVEYKPVPGVVLPDTPEDGSEIL